MLLRDLGVYSAGRQGAGSLSLGFRVQGLGSKMYSRVSLGALQEISLCGFDQDYIRIEGTDNLRWLWGLGLHPALPPKCSPFPHPKTFAGVSE